MQGFFWVLGFFGKERGDFYPDLDLDGRWGVGRCVSVPI
jgi:hypothetical protein